MDRTSSSPDHLRCKAADGMPHILPKTTTLSSPPPSLSKKKKTFLCLTCSLSKIQWRHHAFSKTWVLLWCGKQGPCFLAGTLGVCSDPTAERRPEQPGITDKVEGHRHLHSAHSPQTSSPHGLFGGHPSPSSRCPPPGSCTAGPTPAWLKVAHCKRNANHS